MEVFKNDSFSFADDDGLTMDSLSSGFDDDVFGDTSPGTDEKDKDDNNGADDIDPEDVFGDAEDGDGQESVGNKKDKKDKVDAPDSDDTNKGSSPKKSHSSAYLKALKDDGVLPDLDDEFIDQADTPEKFAEAIEKQVEARLDEQQRRIKEALDNKVAVDDIKRFEGAINYLSQIDEDSISDESEESENLRKNLIYQDFINKGFKPERAKKEVEKSFNAGTDIEDAKLALESNREYFTEEYNELIAEQKEKAKQERIQKENSILEFKKKVMEGEDPLGIKVDKSTRQKILDNIVKPTFKDVDGRLLTPLQKYSKDNPNDAEYFFSLFYTMTNGFKNIDKLVGHQVKAKTKSSLKELDNKLRNTPIGTDGMVDFNFGSDDEESYFGKGIKLDI